MNTIRRNPPKPVPSQIEGTLKLRRAARDETVAPETAGQDRGRQPPFLARERREDRGATGQQKRSDQRESRSPARPGRDEAGSATEGRRDDRSARPAGNARRGEAGERGARAPRGEQGRPAGKPTGAAQRRSDRAVGHSAPTSAPARVPGPPVTPRTSTAEGVRLSKVMADRGICSRREADELIERGWVFVDGKRISELGVRIDPDARIVLAPEARRQQAERVTILLHKPVGYVSGQPEPGYQPAVSLIGPDNQFDRDTAQRFHPSVFKGLAPAGRLDIDSTGLLVLTQDGRVARQLIGDDSEVEKEYLVRVEGQLAENGLALLNHGLWLDDRPLRPAKVEWINEDQLRFVLREGRKRQIRRMCELVGLKVVGLKRVRIGKVKLGDLPLGQWRFLTEDEGFA